MSFYQHYYSLVNIVDTVDNRDLTINSVSTVEIKITGYTLTSLNHSELSNL